MSLRTRLELEFRTWVVCCGQTGEHAMVEKVNLSAAFETVPTPWTPLIVGALNGQHVKLARARGSFVWHHHERADELFLVVAGVLDMHLRDSDGAERVLTLEAGEFTIVPRGVEHKPVARDGDVQLLLFEPEATRNTGNVDGVHTIEPEDLRRFGEDG